MREISQPTHSDAFHVARIKSQLERIKSYIDAGHMKDVRNAIEGLFTEKSLRNWLNDPEKALTSSILAKDDPLRKVIDRLEESIDIDYLSTYRFSVRELKMDLDSQRSLDDYLGIYHVTTSLPRDLIEISHVRIMLNNDKIPIFILRAKFSVYSKKCDGLVFDSGKNIIMSGLSEYINAFIVVNKVIRPRQDVMHGIIAIENRVSGDCYSSEVYLTHETNERMKKSVEERIGNHFVKV